MWKGQRAYIGTQNNESDDAFREPKSVARRGEQWVGFVGDNAGI